MIAKDPQALGELLTDDFVAVEVDNEGTRTKEQLLREIAQPVFSDYAISRFDSQSLGPDAELTTYEVFLHFLPGGQQVRYVRLYASEIWVKRDGSWKALHYQETKVR
jgi:hypothetical protein